MAHDLADDASLSGAGVEVDQDDLLPGAEGELAFNEGDDEGRAEQGGSDVRVAIVVLPGFFVFVACVLGGYFFEGGGQVVLDESRFVFHGGQGRCRAYVEEGDGSGLHGGGSNEARHLLGQVDDVCAAVGFDVNGFGFDHFGSSCVVFLALWEPVPGSLRHIGWQIKQVIRPWGLSGGEGIRVEGPNGPISTPIHIAGQSRSWFGSMFSLS